MAIQRPFNLNNWIEENRHLLKPPVGNQCVYKEAGDFIVMIVGGPNSRKDFHYNESEELFYQLQGDIVVRIVEDGKIVDIPIKEGDMFLLPARVPHSPQRTEGSVGLVVEKVREAKEDDGFMWFCEECNAKLYDEYFKLTDIVQQLPPIMDRFYSDEKKRTCASCGHVMEPPAAKK
ncbi:MAG: 3-hydroxyanthranilate 3,4-dioxygenase [Chitinophagales bacterium]|nr:3-hydroxyanthranilate 3,4-dioxygenase [Chitinophagaceae bacterium]MCB9066110.1 3-hydroxyanthranilate 3,4-dioxygenase [Chitinophagales bacterium]